MCIYLSRKVYRHQGAIRDKTRRFRVRGWDLVRGRSSKSVWGLGHSSDFCLNLTLKSVHFDMLKTALSVPLVSEYLPNIGCNFTADYPSRIHRKSHSF